MITSLGFVLFIASSIKSISVSPKNSKLSLFTCNLSALIFICSADSSPETYKIVTYVFNLSHICYICVYFPIPGSPPNSTNEPLTKPPPNTLSSSLNPVDTLVASVPTT